VVLINMRGECSGYQQPNLFPFSGFQGFHSLSLTDEAARVVASRAAAARLCGPCARSTLVSKEVNPSVWQTPGALVRGVETGAPS
jgi:hypothetical protein